MFDHPVFDEAAIHAQGQLPDLQGHNHTFFAGAWTRYGFHEDGLLSAVNVAALLGISPPWQTAKGAST
jgi:predicted NAD/FAD-binding protein